MPTKLRRRLTPFFTKLGELKPLLFLIVFLATIIFLAPKLYDFIGKAIIVPRFITSLLFNKEIELKKEDGTINILLLGIAGANHDGATLTDTIMIAHVDPSKNKVVLVSIPRDLWVPILTDKINAAYEFGEQKKKGGGLTLAKATISDILNQTIHYALRIDFAGFVRFVDELGGIQIDVERSFDDFNYPIPGKENDQCGKSDEEFDEYLATISAIPNISPSEAFPCRVEYLHFDKGPTHMDGTTALKYVRSRQAQGEEGTDFARSRRQQKVLMALRDKVLSAGVLLNPPKLIQLTKMLGNSIDTDIMPEEYDDFIKLAQKMQDATVNTIVLDQGDEQQKKPGLLVNPPISEYGSWVLVPRSGDFKEIQEYITCVISDVSDCTIK